MNWVLEKSKKRTNSKSRKIADQEAEAKLEQAKANARIHRNRKAAAVNKEQNSNKNRRAASPKKRHGDSNKKHQRQEAKLDLNHNIPPTNRNRARSRTRPDNPKRSSLKDENAPRQQRRRRSSISFCEQLQVKDIIPAGDLVDDKHKLWWDNTEYKQIVELSVATVDLARVDKTTYTRGLEDLMRQDHEATNKTRDDVLLAQQILRQKQIQDADAISGLYHKSTAKYSQEAELRAMQDEKEVQNYLADVRRKARRTWSV